MRTRGAASGDALAIARIHVASWRAAYRGLMPDALLDKLSVDERAAAWRTAIDRGEPAVEVAVDDAGDVVGWVAFGRCRDGGAPPTTGEVWAIYVDPPRWWQGAGRALWRAARDAMRTNYTEAVAWVLRGNERAQRFYAAAGFAIEPDVVKYADFAGVALAHIRCTAHLARTPDRASNP
jgi:L-amino acid N-acyltransferase YncA